MVVLATDHFLLIFVWKLLQETFKMRIFKSMVGVWKNGDLLAFFHQKICQDIFLNYGIWNTMIFTQFFNQNNGKKIDDDHLIFFSAKLFHDTSKMRKIFLRAWYFRGFRQFFWNCSAISKVGVFEEHGVQNRDFRLIFRLFFFARHF